MSQKNPGQTPQNNIRAMPSDDECAEMLFAVAL
jgi:hypothetical protein